MTSKSIDFGKRLHYKTTPLGREQEKKKEKAEKKKREVDEQIAQQQVEERARLAESENDVAMRRASAMTRRGGRLSLIRSNRSSTMGGS